MSIYRIEVCRLEWDYVFVKAIHEGRVFHAVPLNTSGGDFSDFLEFLIGVMKELVKENPNVYIDHESWTPGEGQNAVTAIFVSSRESSHAYEAVWLLRTAVIRTDYAVGKHPQNDLLETPESNRTEGAENIKQVLTTEDDRLIEGRVSEFLRPRSGKRVKNTFSLTVPQEHSEDYASRSPGQWPAHDSFSEAEESFTLLCIPNGRLIRERIIHLIEFDLIKNREGRTIDVFVESPIHRETVKQAEENGDLLEVTMHRNSSGRGKKHVADNITVASRGDLLADLG